METLPAPLDRDEPGAPSGVLVDDRYRMGERIASGGMGIVFAARHEVLGTRLAIKVLRPELSREPEMIGRFRREARAASALGHPHIVDVRDFGTMPDGSAYFVMERLDGRDLSGEISAHGPLGAKRAAHIGVQILDALRAAHRHGIVHRDLKPENVFLTERGGERDYVKVLDFGVAKILGASFASTIAPVGIAAERKDPRLSMFGSVLGTPAYMSPEQCRGSAIDARSDLYSLGIVLFEMLTGEIPFDHQDPFELMRLHMTERPVAPSALAADVPPELDSLILRCLAKSPDDRFASADELAEALAKIAGERPAPVSGAFALSRASSVPTPAPRATPPASLAPAGPAASFSAARASTRQPRRGRSLLAFASLVAIVAVVAAGAAIALRLATSVAVAPAPIATPPNDAPALGAAPEAASIVESSARVERLAPASLLPATAAPDAVVPPLPQAPALERASARLPSRTARAATPTAPPPAAPPPAALPPAALPPADVPGARAAPRDEPSPALRQVMDPWED